MLFVVVIATLFVSSLAQFDAPAAQRRAAFVGIGAPASDVTLPFLKNVTSLQPNTTFILPNGTGTTESSGAFDYRLALTLPWKYLRAERLGKLPPDNGIPWRANSFLGDPVINSYADAVTSSYS